MFEKNANAYDIWSQAQLYKSTAIIVGCGGGGGVVAELLARTGIGNLILIDGDKYEESNLNRQIGATLETIGKYKTDVLKERIEKINPYITIKSMPIFLTKENYSSVLKPYLQIKNLVISDTVDGIENKCFISDICVEYQIPLVSGGDGVYSAWIGNFTDPIKINTNTVLKNINKDDVQCHSSPVLVWAQAAMQANEVINSLLKRNWNVNNKVIYFNNMTYSMSVKDISEDNI